MKLELKHIKYYECLKCIAFGEIDIITGIDFEINAVTLLNRNGAVLLKDIKPILTPISELNNVLQTIYKDFKFENIDIVTMKYATIVNYTLMGENFKDIIFSQGSFNACPMYVFEKLLENKVDVFNLIQNNLAISKTL
jgi:hypothetical protein